MELEHWGHEGYKVNKEGGSRKRATGRQVMEGNFSGENWSWELDESSDEEIGRLVGG